MTKLHAKIYTSLAALSATVTAAQAHPGHSDVPHVHVASASQTWLELITLPGLAAIAVLGVAYAVHKTLSAKRAKRSGGAS